MEILPHAFPENIWFTSTHIQLNEIRIAFGTFIHISEQVFFYLLQEKVMFSEAFVCPKGRGGLPTPPPQKAPLEGRPPPITDF